MKKRWLVKVFSETRVPKDAQTQEEAGRAAITSVRDALFNIDPASIIHKVVAIDTDGVEIEGYSFDGEAIPEDYKLLKPPEREDA